MLNLIRKDFIVLSTMLKWLIPYALVLSFVFNEMVGILVVVILISYTLNLEVRNQNQALVLSLPVTRRDIVKARYLSLILFAVIGVALSILGMLGQYLISFLSADNPVFKFNLLVLMIQFLGTLLIMSVYFPIYYILGEKAQRFSNLLFLALIGIMSFVFASVVQKKEQLLNVLADYSIWLWPTAFLIILVWGLSYILSIRIFAKQDS